jgi:hypothetical protein
MGRGGLRSASLVGLRSTSESRRRRSTIGRKKFGEQEILPQFVKHRRREIRFILNNKFEGLRSNVELRVAEWQDVEKILKVSTFLPYPNTPPQKLGAHAGQVRPGHVMLGNNNKLFHISGATLFCPTCQTTKCRNSNCRLQVYVDITNLHSNPIL